MKLWTQWLQAVRLLRPACHRSLTFVWMALVLMGLCCRSDNAGVTSFVRILNFSGQAYHRFLHLFHSKAVDLDVLTSCWVRLCLVLFRPLQIGARLVCIADGIKAPKEGKRMPGVKYLHQQSASNTKPEYIMGHSLQAVSLLVHCSGGLVAGIPLTSRIHEGVVFSNRDSKTLLDKLVALLFSITRAWNRPVVLVADAYYAIDWPSQSHAGATISAMFDWSSCEAVERDPERVSGAWVFRGTRVSIAAPFENLEDGVTLEEFVELFPGVSLAQLRAVLEHTARSALTAA